MQGVGGGGLFALSEIVVADIVTLRERGKYSGLISAVRETFPFKQPSGFSSHVQIVGLGACFGAGAHHRWGICHLGKLAVALL